MKRKHILLIILALAVVNVALIGMFMIYTNLNSSAIPRSIAKKAAFTVLETDQESYPINKSSVSYDTDKGILSYKASGSLTSIAVTEQQIPDSFVDIPQVYPALLNKMHQYAELNTNAGTVALTHPEELKGGQTAVLRSQKGVLLFARPDKNLTDDQWRKFFNSLEAV